MPMPSSGRLAAGELPQDVVKDSAVLEIVALLRCIDPHANLEADGRAGGRRCGDAHDLRSAAIDTVQKTRRLTFTTYKSS